MEQFRFVEELFQYAQLFPKEKIANNKWIDIKDQRKEIRDENKRERDIKSYSVSNAVAVRFICKYIHI